MKLMQDAWLQGQVGKEADAAAFLAKLFRSRGKGVNTPFSPMPKVVVLIEECAAETRRNLQAKSAQTSDEVSDVPIHYIETLRAAYASYVRTIGECTVVRVDCAEVAAAVKGVPGVAADVFATALCESVTEQLAASPAPREEEGDAPTSPTSEASRSVWERIEAPTVLSL